MEDAQLYVSANALQRRDALVVLTEYLPQMAWQEEGENILDIGCGSGKKKCVKFMFDSAMGTNNKDQYFNVFKTA